MKALSRVFAASLAVLFAIAPAFAAYIPFVTRFGGDGLDGNVNLTTTQTESAARQYNYNQYIVGSAGTHNVVSGTVLNVLNTFTVSGVLAVGNGFPGGSAFPGANGDPGGAGMGPCPGGSGQNVLIASTSKITAGGGGGGGCGGSGGTGGGRDAPHQGGIGGNANANTIIPGMAGSGGGAGYANGIGQDGPGGAGGGRFVACTEGAISVPTGGVIRANGQAGTAGVTNGCGGGAGSGGVEGLFSKTSISIAGSLNMNGAIGGAGAGTGGGGGGGGGGIAYLMAPTITLTGSVTESAGAAGSGGAIGATAGSSGYTVTVTGSPNLPLVVFMLDHPGTFRDTANKRHTNLIALTKYELCQIAANGDANKAIALMRDDNQVVTEFTSTTQFAPSKREEYSNAA